MQLIGILISAGVTIFSLGLLIISIASYKKFHNTKLLIISLIFIILLIKGILFSISVFYQNLVTIDLILYSIYSGLFDFSILVILYIATLKS